MRLFDEKIDGTCPNCGGPYLWDCWLPFPTDDYLGPWETKNVIRCRNCRWWKKVENVEGVEGSTPAVPPLFFSRETDPEATGSEAD